MKPLTLLSTLMLLASCVTNETTVKNSDTNGAPVADAGPDVSLTEIDNVALDGGQSYDPDGDSLTFHWSFDHVPEASELLERESPFAVNHDASTSTWFTPDATGTYVVALMVEDSKGKNSATDYAVVTVDATLIPVADAGTDQNGSVSEVVTLDGSASHDPEGRSLSYAWDLVYSPTGSTVKSLTNATDVNPTFTPDLGGVYIAALVVNNGLQNSSSDAVNIRVSSADPQPPMADAGEDQFEIYDCTLVDLDGTGSYDPNGDALSYIWTVQTKPEGSSVTDEESFSDRTIVTPTFYPDVGGTYVISLAVSDGESWSVPDTVNLYVSERPNNEPPVVEAGSPQVVSAGDALCELSGYTYECESCEDVMLTLGGDASVSDPDGDPYSYGWTLLSGEASIADTSSTTTSVTLTGATPTQPDACEENEYEFELSATDCPGMTANDTVLIVVTCCGYEETKKPKDKK